MNREAYIQSSARIRVFEKSLLSQSLIIRMAEEEDLKGALKHLKDTRYAQYFSIMKRDEDYELMLNRELEDAYKYFYEISPYKELVSIQTLKYEYHNLKLAAKEIASGQDFGNIFINAGNLDYRALQTEYETGSFALQRDHYGKLLTSVLEDYAEKKDPQRFALLLDQQYFRDWAKISEKIESPLIQNYIKDVLDYVNIKILFRGKARGQTIARIEKLLVPGGNISASSIVNVFNEDMQTTVNRFKSYPIGKSLLKGLEQYNITGSLNAYEKAGEDRRIETIQTAKRISYGPEVIFAAMIAKEMETRNLRIILASKIAGMNVQEISQRLRDTYV